MNIPDQVDLNDPRLMVYEQMNSDIVSPLLRENLIYVSSVAGKHFLYARRGT